jgi:hypothetical protein
MASGDSTGGCSHTNDTRAAAHSLGTTTHSVYILSPRRPHPIPFLSVRLDLTDCPDYALFAGQTVGVCGVNLQSHTLRATRILPGRLPPNEMPPDERQITPKAFNVLVAAGPFCTTDNLAYAPLDELLAQASGPHAILRLRPHLCSSPLPASRPRLHASPLTGSRSPAACPPSLL